MIIFFFKIIFAGMGSDRGGCPALPLISKSVTGTPGGYLEKWILKRDDDLQPPDDLETSR